MVRACWLVAGWGRDLGTRPQWVTMNTGGRDAVCVVLTELRHAPRGCAPRRVPSGSAQGDECCRHYTGGASTLVS